MKRSFLSCFTRFCIRALGLVLLLTVAPAAVRAQEEPKTPAPAPPAPTGRPQNVSPHPGMTVQGQIAAGFQAPDFELDGSSGHPERLAAMRGNWVLLIFADRKDSIAALGWMAPTLRNHGIRLVGVCNEKARTLEMFAARTPPQVLILADVTGEVSALYGLRDPLQAMTLPGYVLVDPRGVVQIALLGRTLPPAPVLQLVIETAESS